MDGLKQVSRNKTEDLDPLSMFMMHASIEPEPVPEINQTATFEPEVLATPTFKKYTPAPIPYVEAKVEAPSRESINNISKIPSVKSTGSLSASRVSPVTENDEQIDDIEIPFSLLTGEQISLKIIDSSLCLPNGRKIPGAIVITNYRFCFAPPTTILRSLMNSNPSILHWMSVPLTCIEKIEKERVSAGTRESKQIYIITLICKDCRQLKLQLLGQYSDNSGSTLLSDIAKRGSVSLGSLIGDGVVKKSEIDRSIEAIESYAFPNNVKNVFAFAHSLPAYITRVVQYDTITEFTRQGLFNTVNSDGWRMSDVNSTFQVCDSYPKLLVVPRNMSDNDLVQVANFRSGKRLPTLSWIDKGTGCSLWRSAQPKSGVSGSSVHDERFLSAISQSCIVKTTPLGVKKRVANPELFILDCRPRASAMANRAAGAGYENTSNYPYARLEFYGIGNIHTMRDSYKQLCSLMLNPNTANDVSFSKSVEDTSWLYHIRLVIRAGYDAAVSIMKEVPVLVHCSHGWDRTAQVCGIAQLFLDPYYRTLDGFQMLVEKEFISFGHPLFLRCGHGYDCNKKQEDQISPILLQFLDCVWQLVNQYPHYFEFNKRFLLTIADNVYSSRFGTFLLDCDSERERLQSRTNCVDLWTYLYFNRSAFYNPFYLDPNDSNSSTTFAFLPPLSEILRNVTLWTDYYFRWSSVATMIVPPSELIEGLTANDNGMLRSPDFEMFAEFNSPPEYKISDLQLFYSHMYDNLWEAAYVREREKRESLERQLEGVPATVCSDSHEEKRGRTVSVVLDSSDSKPVKRTGPSNEEIIDNLIALLRSKGVDDEEIRKAVISNINNDDLEEQKVEEVKEANEREVLEEVKESEISESIPVTDEWSSRVEDL